MPPASLSPRIPSWILAAHHCNAYIEHTGREADEPHKMEPDKSGMEEWRRERKAHEASDVDKFRNDTESSACVAEVPIRIGDSKVFPGQEAHRQARLRDMVEDPYIRDVG